jgi:alpha-N-arabinofuranosidase
VAGLHGNASGDERYYNNIFVNGGLVPYDPTKLPVFMAGNVFVKGAKPSKHESTPLVEPDADPGIKLVEKSGGMYLKITLDKDWGQQQRQLVTTALLGRAKIPDLPYEQADGSPLKIDTDYFGTKRNEANPSAGPFEYPEGGELVLKVWPVD